MTAHLPTLPEPGALIGGRFRILQVLGTGGFGTVYRALQENVGRDVALKFLTPGIAKDPINVERFRREAFHVSQLRHPNTITMYDYGQTEDGLIYMVMEYLEGASLANIIQQDGAFESSRAAHIYIQILKSLSEAHRRGLVHRDLKPENIFLCEMFGEQDYVKVLDFGVAKMTMHEDGGAEETDGQLTKAGRIFGTPMYMAPEQACAEPITPATDIYALGLLLFETMTGRPPVSGRNRMEVIHKQIRDEVPDLSPDMAHSPIGQLIRKACQKNPANRFADAAALLNGFLEAIHQAGIIPAPRGATRPEISTPFAIAPEPPRSAARREETATPPRTAQAPSARKASRTSEPPSAAPMLEERTYNTALPALQPPAATAAAGRTLTPPPAHAAPPKLPRPLPRPGTNRPTPTPAQAPAAITAPQAPAGVHAPSAGEATVIAAAPAVTSTPARREPLVLAPRADLALIGRDEELANLREIFLQGTRNRRGHMVLLEGESSLGKSRLVRELHVRLGQDGLAVTVGQCRKRALPMEGVRDALLRFWQVSNAEASLVERTVGAALMELGGFEEDDRQLLLDFLAPRASNDTTLDLTEAGPLYARLERLLVALAERRPLVVVLEDVHYGDSATLDFLEYLAVTLRTHHAPLFVLMTLRPEERSLNPDLDPSLRDMHGNLGAGFTRLKLRRLRGRDLAVLLDAIMPLEPRLKERIGWLSQGVPMHAQQIIRYLQNEGNLVLHGDRWALRSGTPREINLPPDLMDLMHLRIEQAIHKRTDCPHLRQVTDWLALLGMRTPVELLCSVLESAEGLSPEVIDAHLAALTEEAIAHQTMHLNMVCVEFDNSLLRESLLRELMEQWAARRLHAVAADHKILFYQGLQMEVPLLEVADHWRHAGDHERYRDTLFAAARRAMQRYDMRGAREQYRELVRLLEETNSRAEMWTESQLAQAELARRFGEFGLAEEHYRTVIEQGTAQGRERSRALRGFAHLLTVQCRYHDATQHYSQALDWSQQIKDGPGVSKALIGLSRVHLLQGDARAGEQVRTRLEEMVQNLPEGEMSGKVLLHLAEAAQRRGQLARRHEYLLRARSSFEKSNDRQGLSDALVALGSSLADPTIMAPDRLLQSGRVLREALEIKRSIGDRWGLAEAYRYLGQLETELGDFESADSLLKQSLGIHEALGAPFNIGATHNALGVMHLIQRHYAEAMGHFDQSVELFRRMGDQVAISQALLNKGITAINLRQISDAQAMLREARRIKESLGTTWALFDLRNNLAIVALWLGDFETAEQLLEETLEQVDALGTAEDRALARSLCGLLRCFQSRLQLAALELGRARADAEDLHIDRVTIICQANAAFYAALTQAESTFQSLIDGVTQAPMLHSLDRDVWAELLENMALHTLQRDKSRQAARLLRTVATFWERFGHRARAQKLRHQATLVEKELGSARG